MNDHLRAASDVEDEFEFENDEDFQLIESMKNLGRKYIATNLTDIQPNEEQRIAVVLHPRMKRLRRMPEKERDDIYAVVDSLIYKPTKDAIQPTQTDNNNNKSHQSETSLDGFMDMEDEEDGAHSNYSTELHQYLTEKLLNEDDFNLREWWFNNRKRYPSLFKLFLRISCIPASRAPSERTFSTAGAIITDRRSSLLPKSVSDIMLCRNLYRM